MVDRRIGELLRESAFRNSITVDRITQEVAAIAFFDIGEVAAWGMAKKKPVLRRGVRRPPGPKPKDEDQARTFVNLRNSDELDERVRRAIKLVKKTKYGVEVQPYDKLAALIRLGTQLGMWRDEDKAKDEGADALVRMIVEAHEKAVGDHAKVINGKADGE